LIMVQDTCWIEGVIFGRGYSETCRTWATPSNNCVNRYYENTISAGGGGRGYSTTTSSYICTDYASLSYSVYGSPFTLLYGNPGFSSSTGIKASTCVDGPNGTSVPPEVLQDAIQLRPYLAGLSGQIAGGCSNYSSGGGGSGLTIVCKVLIFTGEVNISGGDGKNACVLNSYQHGSGGGGGGCLIISSDEIISNTGTVQQIGGQGGKNWGSGCGSNYGGDGGDGAYIILEY